jgi:hypothetical protein
MDLADKIPPARVFRLGPSVRDISDDTPPRLDIAVKAAFPAGGITVAGFRKEIAKGRLDVELIAGKLFTTLGAIARMRERCRVIPKKLPGRDAVAPKNEDAAKSLEIAQANLEALLVTSIMGWIDAGARSRTKSKRQANAHR